MFASDLERWAFNAIPNKQRFWTTLDGRRIPVYKLEDRHLVNCIKMMLRLCDYYRECDALLVAKFMAQMSDDAQMAFGTEDFWFAEPNHEYLCEHRPIYKTLVDEAAKRKLLLHDNFEIKEWYVEQQQLQAYQAVCSGGQHHRCSQALPKVPRADDCQ